ncbi:MAG: hypothetical protein GY874_23620 [Desulfobacteraceae bacterium]|nr:hypothetical protein [Desulfobacteraceae bacterium]
MFGRIFIVVDKPLLPEDERTGTNLDNLDPNAQPYCYYLFPQNVLDYPLDKNGKFRWALVKEQYRDDQDPFAKDEGVQDRYRLWRPGKYNVYDHNGYEIKAGDTGIQNVPIVILDNEEGDKWEGQSLIRDIAYLDRATFNNWSRLDVIVNEQTFSQLIFPIEGLPPEIITDKNLREKYLTLAVNRILLYSASAAATPGFISPDASQA